MKTLNKILLGAVILLLAGSLGASAQEITLMDWNVLSFGRTDKTGEQTGFPVEGHAALISNSGADVVTLNEFGTAQSKMEMKEKAAQLAAALGMYSYFIESYGVDVGFYGNAILSRYPIVSAGSQLFPYKNHMGEGNYTQNADPELSEWGSDQRSVGYVDILVPTGDNASTVIRVVCSHFDHRGNSSVRLNQSKGSVSFASLDSPVYPTIMAGDLNTGSQTELQPLYDAGTHVDINWGGASTFSNIDHIFLFPKTGWEIVGTPTFVAPGNLSDHSAIVGTLRLK